MIKSPSIDTMLTATLKEYKAPLIDMIFNTAHSWLAQVKSLANLNKITGLGIIRITEEPLMQSYSSHSLNVKCYIPIDSYRKDDRPRYIKTMERTTECINRMLTSSSFLRSLVKECLRASKKPIELIVAKETPLFAVTDGDTIYINPRVIRERMGRVLVHELVHVLYYRCNNQQYFSADDYWYDPEEMEAYIEEMRFEKGRGKSRAFIIKQAVSDARHEWKIFPREYMEVLYDCYVK